MSSKDFQVVKRMRRIQLNPQTSGGEDVKSSTKVKKIGSTRTGSKEKFVATSGTSATVSGRELNRDALTIVRDRNQLPARDSSKNSGGNQISKESRTVQRFGFGASGSGNQNNRTGGYSGMDQQISSKKKLSIINYRNVIKRFSSR